MKYVFAFLVLTLLTAPVKAEPSNTTFHHYDNIVSTDVLRCGYFEWPPFLYKNAETGKMQGISNDIMEAIGKTLELKIEWTAQVGLADFMDDLQADKFDALCISNWPQADRFKKSLATIPLYYTSMYPVVRFDDKRLDTTYNGLKKGDLKIGVISGDTTEEVVKKLYPAATRETLSNSKSYADLFVALEDKKADVIFLDKSVINDFIKNNPETVKIPKLSMPVFNYPEYLFVKRGDIETKLMLDNAIAILRDSGEMQTLLEKSVNSSSVFPLVTFSSP